MPAVPTASAVPIVPVEPVEPAEPTGGAADGGVVKSNVTAAAGRLPLFAQRDKMLIDVEQRVVLGFDELGEAVVTLDGLHAGDGDLAPQLNNFLHQFASLAGSTGRGSVADHIDHMAALAGVDHVGIGSDFDGIEDNVVVGLEDVSTYPNTVFHGHLVCLLNETSASDGDIHGLRNNGDTGNFAPDNVDRFDGARHNQVAP